MSKETIWERAYKLFEHRLKYGIAGNRESDWLRAREELEQEKSGYIIATIEKTRVRAKMVVAEENK